jgi:prepilin-type N-terminal cleavage/methylation domain-containing protein
MAARNEQAGFTLIEVMIAVAVLALVATLFLTLRTTALVDATETRNVRVARELAEQMLSELMAGARETAPESGIILPLEKYPGFSYQFLIGEKAISEWESNQANEASFEEQNEEGFRRHEQLAWVRERDEQRLARQKGLSVTELREQELEREEKADEVPSETETEDVAIVVAYPDVRAVGRAVETGTFVLKAKISTLAISGLTPQQSDEMAKTKGASASANAPGNTGSEGASR